MTAPFLHACWLAAPASEVDPVAAHVRAVRRLPGAGATAAYALEPRTPVMQAITSRLGQLDADAYARLPNRVVLTELADLDAGLDLDAHLRRESGDAAAKAVVVRGLYREIVSGDGTDPAPAVGFGPVIQLGTFTMRSAADEWAVCEWYRNRRLPSFSTTPGSIRARRFVSACGGPAKLAVLYEFSSLEQRRVHFEPLESADHDEHRPTAAARTVHPPMSPGIGTALTLPQESDLH